MNELDKSIIEFIKEYGIEHGYLPTVRDISAGLNISQARAFKRFKTLEERGMLFREGQKYRVKGLKYISEEKVVPVSVLDEIVREIKEWYWQSDKQKLAEDPCVVDAMISMFIDVVKKYKRGEEG